MSNAPNRTQTEDKTKAQIKHQSDKPLEDKVKVWDISTRSFHWLLMLSIFLCWLTMENRWLLAHQLSGYFVLFLLIFRLIWGFWGSKTARFSDFIKWPWHAIIYLKISFKKHDYYHTGHNPAGGWMVVFFLFIILLQVLTGLFSNDDIGFSGPLADLILKDNSDFATNIHIMLFDLLLLLIWLHLVAVFFYVMVKKQNLVSAMITGKKPSTQIGDITKLFFVSQFRILFAAAIAATLPLYFYFA